MFFIPKQAVRPHEFIEIPEGFSCFGSDELDPYASEKEKPLRQVFLSTFFMSKHPTTVEQFVLFLNETNNASLAKDSLILKGLDGTLIARKGYEHYPVTGVSWELATAYCKWLSVRINQCVTLPSEAEWEKAARGEDSRIWSWGNVFDSSCCNSSESCLDRLCDVDDFSKGASPYGVMHLCGNVWEWCQDYWNPTAHNDVISVNPINLKPSDRKVVKGGSAYCTKEVIRISCRDWTNSVNQGGGDDGFRVIIRPDKGA